MENIGREELERLVGINKVNIFYHITDLITSLYGTEQIWNNGGKNGHMNISSEKAEKLYVLLF